MSKISFQGKVTLNSAFEPIASSGNWEINVTFQDLTGNFLATDLAVGDVLVFDTSTYEPGTYSKFVVSSITDATAGTGVINCVVSYDATQDNQIAPDLSYITGFYGLATRPTAAQDLLPTPSTDAHIMTDDFAEYVSNMNLNTLDAAVGTGGSVDQTQLDNSISAALVDYSTTVEMNTAISDATTDLVDTTALNEAIGSATSSFVTSTQVDGQINTKLVDYSTTAQMTAAIGTSATNTVNTAKSYTDTQISNLNLVTAIDDLTDVDTSTAVPTNGQALVWNGTNWVPGTVASSETTTTLSLSGNVLTYTDETGTSNDISLAAYLDDTTNTVVSASLSGTTITFTREDATTFTLDVTNLYDDTNLVTSVAGQTGAVTLGAADVGITVTTTSVSDGTTTFNQYDDTALAARVTTLETTGGGSVSALDDITDVVLTTPVSGEVLQYDGTNWVNGTVSGSGTFSGSYNDLTDVPTNLAKTDVSQSFNGVQTFVPVGTTDSPVTVAPTQRAGIKLERYPIGALDAPGGNPLTGSGGTLNSATTIDWFTYALDGDSVPTTTSMAASIGIPNYTDDFLLQYVSDAGTKQLFRANKTTGSLSLLGKVTVSDTAITAGTGVTFTGAHSGDGSLLTNLPVPAGSPTVEGLLLGITDIEGTGLGTTALGTGALAQVTTGASNTAVGPRSQRLVTTGRRNTSVGVGTLGNMVAGNENVAIGYNAGAGLKGTSNCAIGSTAMAMYAGQDAAVTINNNVAIGREVMSNVNGFAAADGTTPVTTTYNVGIGDQSLRAFKSGSFNTTIGYASGLDMTQGEGNTFIGKYAGYNMAEGNNNLVIGNNVGVDGIVGTTTLINRSNQIVIGNTLNNRLIVPGLNIDTNNAQDDEVLRWNSTTGKFEWFGNYTTFDPALPAPSGPGASGTPGDIRYASGFAYLCVAANTWVRYAVDTTW